jgi:hypothetical protein
MSEKKDIKVILKAYDNENELLQFRAHLKIQ